MCACVGVCSDCVLTCLIPVALGFSSKQDGATWGTLLGKYDFISNSLCNLVYSVNYTHLVWHCE